MYLNGNRLTGPIPAWLGDLTSLATLSLSQNPMGGAIPPELGNLRNLVRLHLNDNQLTGEPPSALGQPPQPGVAVPQREPVDRADTGMD